MNASQDWEYLGTMIKRHRRRRGMTQTDLARAAGLSLRTVGNYERGRIPDSAPIVPDGYYDVARILEWSHDSIDTVLAGGDPEPARASERTLTDDDVLQLSSPALHLADVARDMGAPADLVSNYRMATVTLVGWMTQHPEAAQRGNFSLAAYRPHAIGEGVPPDDAERILRELEDGGDDRA